MRKSQEKKIEKLKEDYKKEIEDLKTEKLKLKVQLA